MFFALFTASRLVVSGLYLTILVEEAVYISGVYAEYAGNGMCMLGM